MRLGPLRRPRHPLGLRCPFTTIGFVRELDLSPCPTVIGKHEALAWLCEGLGFFASLGLHAVLNDKASKIPFEKDHVSNLKWSVSVWL
ncbi:uncharacterized protein LOC103982625 isoform X2 [Musa acuminata AAA Group]|uniref:uncharacterized protein LOC103982625 isoform X2 n=1 Tax=Musa acuminata AAA Group TaxID=214697 RepID=UPI0031D7E667